MNIYLGFSLVFIGKIQNFSKSDALDNGVYMNKKLFRIEIFELISVPTIDEFIISKNISYHVCFLVHF